MWVRSYWKSQTGRLQVFLFNSNAKKALWKSPNRFSKRANNPWHKLSSSYSMQRMTNIESLSKPEIKIRKEPEKLTTPRHHTFPLPLVPSLVRSSGASIFGPSNLLRKDAGYRKSTRLVKGNMEDTLVPGQHPTPASEPEFLFASFLAGNVKNWQFKANLSEIPGKVLWSPTPLVLSKYISLSSKPNANMENAKKQVSRSDVSKCPADHLLFS